MSPTPLATVPTVKVGGRSFGIRYSQGAFYLLGTWGIDVSRAVQVHNEMISAGRGKEYAAKLACAALGNYDADGKWRSLGLPPLEVMDSLLDGEWEALDAAAWGEYKKKLGLVSTMELPATESPSTKNDGSNSGPLEPEAHPPVLDSQV
jgi:hypothetical protein